MSLVTRVSVAFLVALRWHLVRSPRAFTTLQGCAAARIGSRTGGHPRRVRGTALVNTGRVTWAIYDEGRRVESAARRRAADDPRRSRPRPSRGGRRDDDRGARRPSMAGARASIRRRRPPPSRVARGPWRGTSPRQPGRDVREGGAPCREHPPRVLAAWASARAG